MKLRCKSCQKKIKLADYRCPHCGDVNFQTDEEVRAAYNRRAPKGIHIALAGAFAAVNTGAAVIFTVIAVMIALIVANVCLAVKANNDWAFEHVPKVTGFAEANSSGKFEITRVYSESTYPYYEMYMTYNGEPGDFIRESVSLCDMLYNHACEESKYNHRDEFTFKVTCGEMAFVCSRSLYVETNVLFDYSELELFGLKSLTVHTSRMSDEEKQRLDGVSYPFELVVIE